MIIEWEVEGAGCNYAQCGLKTRRVEIPDNEVPDDETARDRFIDEWIGDDFLREVGFAWKIVEGGK